MAPGDTGVKFFSPTVRRSGDSINRMVRLGKLMHRGPEGSNTSHSFFSEGNHMPFVKSAAPVAKKQAPMPGPKSAAYKKIVAARNSGTTAKPAASKSARKHSKTPLFSTLKSRQMLVERIKREIWASVQEINQAVINLALCGNYSAAKALFDFAGVYNLPSPEEAAPSLVPSAASPEPSSREFAPRGPVDAFFKSIGMEPVGDEPDPDMALLA